MKKSTLLVLLVFAGIIGFSACELFPDNGFSFDEKTFNSNRNLWENNNIQNYSFTMTGQFPYWNLPRAILMFDYEVNIVVKNGTMDSFEYIGNNIPYTEDGETILEPEFTSISDIYQKISDRAQESKEWWNNYSGNGYIISTKFVIKYNSEWNYITFFEPVSNWKSGVIVDTTAHAVSLSKFVILE